MCESTVWYRWRWAHYFIYPTHHTVADIPTIESGIFCFWNTYMKERKYLLPKLHATCMLQTKQNVTHRKKTNTKGRKKLKTDNIAIEKGQLCCIQSETDSSAALFFCPALHHCISPSCSQSQRRGATLIPID